MRSLSFSTLPTNYDDTPNFYARLYLSLQTLMRIFGFYWMIDVPLHIFISLEFWLECCWLRMSQRETTTANTSCIPVRLPAISALCLPRLSYNDDLSARGTHDWFEEWDFVVALYPGRPSYSPKLRFSKLIYKSNTSHGLHGLDQMQTLWELAP